MSSGMQRVLVYLLRRDLRLADNPVFHEIAHLNTQSQKPFTHILPVFVFPAEQIEISGFVSKGQKSPYPEARSTTGRFWRCGKLRAKFIAESVWDLKGDLERAQSGLIVRVGSVKDVVRSLLDGYRESKDAEISEVWMTSEDSWEEQKEEDAVEKLMAKENKPFKRWLDEKYFVDDRDLPTQNPREISDVFTNFRKTVEPLRDAPRRELPAPDKLPALPDHIPKQASPFEIPDSFDAVLQALHKPLDGSEGIPNPPTKPAEAKPFNFRGGSKAGSDRIRHLIESGAMTDYKDTRNGLVGNDFSSRLSAWLAMGSITARQVHWRLIDFEDGKSDLGKSAKGYGQGENRGTYGMRFELLWRDYMRLCTRKFGYRLFWLDGFRQKPEGKNFISSPYTNSTEKKNRAGSNDEDTKAALERFLNGTTGMGLIDASQRELYTTGWTSNRARQNVASYLAKHMGIDWRVGAEWYEMNLIDYDVSSNWGNWQYNAGVGNDPRGEGRVFNPVKQAFDYDKGGEYVRLWIPELRGVGHEEDNAEALLGVFQAWRMSQEDKKRLGLEGVDWVEKPLIRIDYSINRRGGGGQGERRGGGGHFKGGRGKGRGRGNHHHG